MKKRIIALLLCCVMIFTLSPSLIASASADDENTVATTEEPKTEEPKTTKEPTVEETTVEESTTEPETEEPTVDKATTLEANGDTAVYGPGDWSSNGSVAITCNIDNAEVAYASYDNSTGNVTLTSVTGTNTTVKKSKSDGQYLVFFIKPKAGYILTEYRLATGAGNVDLHQVGDTDQDIANKFGTVSNLYAKASTAGYIGFFGYTISSANWTDTLYVTGKKPTLLVTAVPEQDNLKPGDTVTFKVTLAGGNIGVDYEITGRRITSLQINGTDYEATQNDDGSFSVSYTVTPEDWVAGKVHLDVTAELDCKYGIEITDRNKHKRTLYTTTTVTNSAEADCTFAEAMGVLYQLQYNAPQGITPEQGLIPDAPTDTDKYFKDDTVTVKAYNRTEVDDPKNGGTWTYSGWCVDPDTREYKENDTLTMGDKGIIFVGTWTFTEYPLADLTITKTGASLLDANQSFVFHVKGADEKTKDIDMDVVIHGNGSVTIKDLPVGSYTVTEKSGWSWRYTPDGGATQTVKVVRNQDGSIVAVTFNNDRDKIYWLSGGTWCDNRFDGKNTRFTPTTTPASN